MALIEASPLKRDAKSNKTAVAAAAMVSAPPSQAITLSPYQSEPAWMQIASSVVFIGKHLLGGAIAGATAKTVSAPLDRVKILYQVRVPKYESLSVIKSMQHITRTEGVQGLWRGNSAMLARVVPYAAIQFATYEQLRAHIAGPDGELKPMQRLLCGSTAGFVSVLATYPLDLARARLAAMQGMSTKVSLSRVLSDTFKHGMKGAYVGFWPTAMGILPYAGLNFYAYGGLKNAYRNHCGSNESGSKDPPLALKLLFGAISGSFAQTICYPLDVIRRRLQVNGYVPNVGNTPLRQNALGWFGMLIAIGRNEGFRGLTRGLSINYVKTPLSVAVSFATYDLIKSFLNSGNPL